MICPWCRSSQIMVFTAKVEAETFLEHFQSEEDLRRKRGFPRTYCPRCRRDVLEHFQCRACGLAWCGGCMV